MGIYQSNASFSFSLLVFVLVSSVWAKRTDDRTGDNDTGLVWQDLVLSTPDGKHVLVHPFSGKVPAGTLCGILGPSGAGKSSFLSALAGLSSLSMEGQVYTYHPPADDAEKHPIYQRIPTHQVAWLQQHDDFFTMLTVEETLDLAAFLELPHLPLTKRQGLVQTQLQRLGLAKVANRRIGDASLLSSERISGGERRRLAVALELLTEKQLLLADEATSGLDSNMSHKVVHLIRQVVQDRNIPALLILHQPRSSIWKLLDYVIVMAAGGHVCYFGPRQDCLPYFRNLGYLCPSETNPAEFLMDLISAETSDDQSRVDGIIQAFAQGQRITVVDPYSAVRRDTVTTKEASSKGPLYLLRRFGALLRRSWRQNIRNTYIHVFRLLASALNAVLLAAIFPSVAPGKPPTAASVADRVALLSFGAINMCFVAFMKVSV